MLFGDIFKNLNWIINRVKEEKRQRKNKEGGTDTNVQEKTKKRRAKTA